jgi:small multidrug resistance family-3 protein
VSINLTVFALAALFEIAGCFAFWIWVRRGATPFVVVLGAVSLVAFALALTRVDSAFAGRDTPHMAGST